MKTLTFTIVLCIAVFTSQIFSQKTEKQAQSTSFNSKLQVLDESKGRVAGNRQFPSIAKIFITLTRLSTGEIIKVKTNSLGYYHFDNVAIGENYVVTPIPIQNHSFTPTNKSLAVNSNLDNVDFIYGF